MSSHKPYEPTDAGQGPSVWRSLEEKRGETASDRAPEAAETAGSFVDASMLKKPFSRRGFMTLSGATAAAVGMAGCIRRPVENILPFNEGPEYIIPGVPLHFATVTERRGDALGLLVTSHEGRPTKIEGNPEHPGSRGKTDVWAQASILDLYDPDRSAKPARAEGGELVDASWKELDAALDEAMSAHEADGGAGLRFLVQPTTSPSFVRMREAVRARFPEARFHTYASVNESNVREGARTAFGEPLQTLYDFERVRVVLALDSDFLCSEPGATRYAKQFAATRRPGTPKDRMSRLFVVEPGLSVTGSNADHRLRRPAGQVGSYLLALAKELVARHGVDLGAAGTAVQKAKAQDVPKHWLEQVAKELVENRGNAPVVVGARQPAWVHALAHSLNAALGNVGRRVRYFAPTDPEPGDAVSELKELAEDVKAGGVKTLVMLGGNPVFDAPSDVGFAELLGTKGLTSFHLSSSRNETSQVSSWHGPRTHELEAWGDQRGLDGVMAVQQPLIAPLFGGRSDIEVLAKVAGQRNWRGHHVVRGTLRATAPDATAFERQWRRTLHRGMVAGRRPTPLQPELKDAEVAAAVGGAKAGKAHGPDDLEVVFAPDHALWDGRHANNQWMLELPHPMTRTVWDNTAQLSPRTAKELGLEDGDVVKLSREGASDVEIAVAVLPGHADWSITLPLGWGRTAACRYGAGHGFDVQPLRTTGGFHFARGVRAAKTRKHELVRAQDHHDMEGRPIAIDGTFEKVDAEGTNYAGMPAYKEQPDFASYRTVTMTVPPLWDEVDYSKTLKWGMTIDLSACTGCSACVVACQAENNVSTVGKKQCKTGREMHWLRVDRYFVGEDEDDPLVAVQPVACQQCEEAPCENVCPVAATSHSPEGLNDMAYNRCIGTRYCMNNCPYKVRRFNYLGYNGYLDAVVEGKNPITEGNYGEMPEVRQMQFNPNVTVRFRGVMEKCTYCVQRIEQARIAARRQGRSMRDGDVVTACQQACPTDAITFGNLNDPNARVTREAMRDRHYKLLAEVGTQPRTTFLAKLRNPSPAMLGAGGGAGGTAEGGGGHADPASAGQGEQ